jgi:xylem cysteine proteinase
MFELNAFGDLTSEEFSAKYTGGLVSDDQELEQPTFEEPSPQNLDIPETQSLGQFPFNPRIRRQGGCGSCWAFATIVEVERALFMRLGAYVDLSQQELVDCDTRNMGCKGGWPEHAFSYIASNGIHKASDYPYIAANGNCRKNLPNKVTFPGFNQTPFRPWTTSYSKALSDRRIHAAIGLFSSGKFRFLSNSDDVYDASLSGECDNGMNHLVAQRLFANNVALIVNSWGDNWGRGGMKKIKACSSTNLWGKGARLAHPWQA